FDIRRGKFDAFAGDDLVETEIVFKRIHAGDVIVVAVLESPDWAAALIGFASHRLAFWGVVDVLVVRAFVDADIEDSLSVRLRRRQSPAAASILVLDELPIAACSLARLLDLPALRKRSGFSIQRELFCLLGRRNCRAEKEEENRCDLHCQPPRCDEG